jgi:hypothetical protein
VLGEESILYINLKKSHRYIIPFDRLDIPQERTMRLFKYMHRTHAKRAIENGEIMIKRVLRAEWQPI